MFQLIQVLYWLALSTWFGGVLFIAVAAPVIFRTITDADPTLPKVLSVNLHKQHSTLLAGSIVANLLDILVRVQIACASVLLVTIGLQWFFINRHGYPLYSAIFRTSLFVAAVALVLYDWLYLWPRVNRYRQEYIEHADEPDLANAAKDSFDRYHAESVSILRNILFLLLGIILFSGDIQLSSMTISFQH